MNKYRVVSWANMANDSISTLLALRKVGVDATQMLNFVDYACAHPEWEYGDFGRNISMSGIDKMIDPYNLPNSELDSVWDRPSWIKDIPLARLSYLYMDFITGRRELKDGSMTMMYEKMNGIISDSLNTPHIVFTPPVVYDAIRCIMEHYDIAYTHIPYSTFLRYIPKPYIVYEAGWIRGMDTMKNAYIDFLRQSYEVSDSIVYTNPDMIDIFKKYPKMRDKIEFIPFAIDTDHYAPQDAQDIRDQITVQDEFLILGMSRQMVTVKGNDITLEAFYKFNKRHPNSRLLLSKWGEPKDIKDVDERTKELGISNKVTWIPFLPKKKLIMLYNAVDCACDQFLIGSAGTAYLEAMSCGCPTLLYYNHKHTDRAFASRPPIPSVRTVDEVDAELERIYNHTNIDVLKQSCREWVVDTHNLKDIGERHKELCERVLRNHGKE